MSRHTRPTGSQGPDPSSSNALVTLAAACLLAACSPEEPGPGSASSPGGEARVDTEGARLYARLACNSCHGPSGAGTSTSPPLLDADRHWTREDLAAYLDDPRTWIQRDERLRALDLRYPIAMPAASVPLEQRLQLADHVLGL
jgi:cytochrome c553